MRLILSLFLVVIKTTTSFACLSASQNRLFPLGLVSNGLCVVEMHLERTHYSEKGKNTIEIKPAWSGIGYFKIYDTNYKEVYSEILDTIGLFVEQ
jgi:hypothetical protein